MEKYVFVFWEGKDRKNFDIVEIVEVNCLGF